MIENFLSDPEIWLIGTAYLYNHIIGFMLDCSKANKVLDSTYLSLSIWTSPGHAPIAAQLSNLRVKLVGQHNSQWHALVCLIRGIAEHKALVASTNLILIAANMNTLGDVRWLFLQGWQYVASLVIKAWRGKKGNISLH